MTTTRASLLAGRLLRVPGAHRPSPSLFTYPGLTSRPWHERSHRWFADWLPELEAATPTITEEYLRMRASGRLSDYKVADSDHQDGLHLATVDEGRPMPLVLTEHDSNAQSVDS